MVTVSSGHPSRPASLGDTRAHRSRVVLAGVRLVVRGHCPVVDCRVDQRSQIIVSISQIRRSRRTQEIQQEKPIGCRVTCSLHGTRILFPAVNDGDDIHILRGMRERRQNPKQLYDIARNCLLGFYFIKFNLNCRF